MKTAKKLNPPVHRTRVQCCRPFEELHCYTEHYIEHRRKKIERAGWDIDKCNKPAVYEIEGDKLCAQHAAIAALNILLEISDEQ